MASHLFTAETSDFAILAYVTRSDRVESFHVGDAVIADVTGEILFAAGNPERVAYFRSSQKPLQALAVVQSGAAEQFQLTQTELAICCASHSGSRMHVLTVQGILEKLGLDENALQCGLHEPSDPEERARLIRERQEPSPLHNNCSGKHAGMLATALALGAPIHNYLDAEHPVQQLIRRNMAFLTDIPESEQYLGIDGCGAPVMAAPLRAMALAYARLANPEDLPADLPDAARQIVSAMAIAPDMIAAPGAFNSELLTAGEGRLVAKGGAEGLMLIGLQDPRRLGIAIKMADGSSRAIPPVSMATLEKVGGLSAGARARLAAFREPHITNCHGNVVGHILAALQLDEA